MIDESKLALFDQLVKYLHESSETMVTIVRELESDLAHASKVSALNWDIATAKSLMTYVIYPCINLSIYRFPLLYIIMGNWEETGKSKSSLDLRRKV
jgi:hypothetical protein